jgi:AcrR family transcriptional regulator
VTAPAGPAVGGDLAGRILDAAGECVSRWGVTKTTLDDIAKQAGCSRATVYRHFPGGKDPLLESLLRRELAVFFSALDGRLRQAPDLETAVTVGVTEALARLQAHPALQFLLRHEPEPVVPTTGSSMVTAIRDGGAFAALHLSRWLPPDAAVEAGEWIVRQILSYVSAPDHRVEPRRPDTVRRFVGTFVLPALEQRQHHPNLTGGSS